MDNKKLLDEIALRIYFGIIDADDVIKAVQKAENDRLEDDNDD